MLLVVILAVFIAWFFFKIVQKTPTRKSIGEQVKITNWEGNVSFGVPKSKFFLPTSINEIIDLITRAKSENKKLRVMGAAHSWSPLIFNDYIISLDSMNKVLELNTDKSTITVQAGIRLKDLNRYLEKSGYALKNLGSVEEQSIAGAISTGTHGTGIQFSNLSSQIKSLVIVTSESPFVRECSFISENADLFHAALVSIGALGIIVQVTIDIVPYFNLKCVEVPTKVEKVEETLSNLIDNTEHLKIWWFPHTNYCQVFKMNRTSEKINKKRSEFVSWFEDVFVTHYVMELLCMITDALPLLATPMNSLCRMGAFGHKERIDVSYKVFTFPVECRHPEMEYSIPIANFTAAWKEIREMIEKNNYCVNFIQEFRFVKGDEAMLSPSYKQDSAYIGVLRYSWNKGFFEKAEKILVKYGGRPHWGKHHSLTHEELSKLYPKWQEFQKIRDKCDPKRIFTTPYVASLLGP